MLPIEVRRERNRIRMAKRRKENPEREREIYNRWRESHPDYFKGYAERKGPEYFRDNSRKYREKNPDYVKVSGKKHREKSRQMVFDHYGERCSWPGCNVTDRDMLQIDHINGGGNAHFKRCGFGTMSMWLVANNFPPGFRILCANHNWKHKANLEKAKAGILRVS
jgi:hypothetical protein